jgi:co-chaperonin GroES (HSP10)
MAQKKWTWKTLVKGLKDNNLALVGERLAILRDEADATFVKEGLIVKADNYTRAPLSGYIVALGNKVLKEEGFFIGQHVNFNKFNVVEFELEFEGEDQPVKVDVLHISDIYWERTK